MVIVTLACAKTLCWVSDGVLIRAAGCGSVGPQPAFTGGVGASGAPEGSTYAAADSSEGAGLGGTPGACGRPGASGGVGASDVEHQAAISIVLAAVVSVVALVGGCRPPVPASGRSPASF